MTNDPIPIRPVHPERVGERVRHPTYISQMLTALKEGDQFTGPEAYERWGVWAVSSMITQLRVNGWKIMTTRDAETGRAIYYLASKRRRRGYRYWPTLDVWTAH